MEVLNPIYKEHPDIMPDEMKPEFITEDEIEKLSLSCEDVKIIKQELLSHISNNWQKVARVIAETMMDLKEKDTKWNGIPATYYAHLIRKFAANNKISCQGDLYKMRYSEICLIRPF